MSSNITDLYQHYLAITKEPQAAATLVLAHVTSQARIENFTVRQAAKQLGVSVAKVYILCESGQLRHRRVGRSIRIQPQDLQAYMDSCPVEAAITEFPLLLGQLAATRRTRTRS